MAERHLIILKYVNNVPLMASCGYCQRKFFTPTELRGNRAEAEQYLLEKFDLHLCNEEPEMP